MVSVLLHGVDVYCLLRYSSSPFDKGSGSVHGFILDSVAFMLGRYGCERLSGWAARRLVQREDASQYFWEQAWPMLSQ